MMSIHAEQLWLALCYCQSQHDLQHHTEHSSKMMFQTVLSAFTSFLPHSVFQSYIFPLQSATLSCCQSWCKTIDRKVPIVSLKLLNERSRDANHLMLATRMYPQSTNVPPPSIQIQASQSPALVTFPVWFLLPVHGRIQKKPISSEVAIAMLHHEHRKEMRQSPQWAICKCFAVARSSFGMADATWLSCIHAFKWLGSLSRITLAGLMRHVEKLGAECQHGWQCLSSWSMRTVAKTSSVGCSQKTFVLDWCSHEWIHVVGKESCATTVRVANLLGQWKHLTFFCDRVVPLKCCNVIGQSRDVTLFRTIHWTSDEKKGHFLETPDVENVQHAMVTVARNGGTWMEDKCMCVSLSIVFLGVAWLDADIQSMSPSSSWSSRLTQPFASAQLIRSHMRPLREGKHAKGELWMENPARRLHKL